jgi:acetyl esterase
MPVDPAISWIVEAANAAEEPDGSLPVEELRARAHALMDKTFLAVSEDPPEVSSTDHAVPVESGQITVRVYRPEGEGPLPAHLYMHGGGFWLGNLDHAETPCRELSAGAGCVVVSVGYRLAPEHKFPVAMEDSYAALCWAFEHASELGIDPARVSVGGASAGGNLAAVVAMAARDRNGPPLVFQLLEIPVTDMTMSKPSIQENGEGYILTRRAVEQCIGYYLNDPIQARDPYASPLLARDLASLPPALVMTAEMDPLRDEGEAYAQRLSEAGVQVRLVRWVGHVHGAGAFTRILPSARDYRETAVAALREAYSGSAGTPSAHALRADPA